MWPQTFIDWMRQITVEDVEMRVRGRLSGYLFLWDNPTRGCGRIAATLAEAGRWRAVEMAGDMQAFPSMFPDLPAFRRWLFTVAHREALRAAAVHPEVAGVFVGTGPCHERVLLHLYIDQFTDDQLATALGVLPVAEAGRTARAAYAALCEHLRRAGWAHDDRRPFPAYPTFPNALTPRRGV